MKNKEKTTEERLESLKKLLLQQWKKCEVRELRVELELEGFKDDENY